VKSNNSEREVEYNDTSTRQCYGLSYTYSQEMPFPKKNPNRRDRNRGAMHKFQDEETERSSKNRAYSLYYLTLVLYV
jgi:hypothetical protein